MIFLPQTVEHIVANAPALRSTIPRSTATTAADTSDKTRVRSMVFVEDHRVMKKFI